MSKPLLRIGTRGSPLALIQAEAIRSRLATAHADLAAPGALEVVTIRTTGDVVRDRTLAAIGGKGLFTKEIEAALLAGEIDLAVHSLKDMATQLPEGLAISCHLPRADPRDAFVSTRAPRLLDLPRGADPARAARPPRGAAPRQRRDAARQGERRQGRRDAAGGRRSRAPRPREPDHRAAPDGPHAAGAGARHHRRRDAREGRAPPPLSGADRRCRHCGALGGRARAARGPRRLVPDADRGARRDRRKQSQAARADHPARRHRVSRGAAQRSGRGCRADRSRGRRAAPGGGRVGLLRPADPRGNAGVRLLITRPRPAAAALAARLTALGHETLIEPLLTIEPDPDAAARLVPALEGCQALLCTSSNGVAAVAAACARRDLRLLAVGEGTAAAARQAGFAAVESAEGDVDALVRLATARLRPGAGPLVHASGHAVAGDLAGRLAKAGFAVRSVPLYQAVAAEGLSAPVAAACRAGRIDAALFFSPRTAATFVRLARAAGLERSCATMAGVALSKAVAGELEKLTWRRIVVAATPTEAAMIASLGVLDAELRPPGARTP